MFYLPECWDGCLLLLGIDIFSNFTQKQKYNFTSEEKFKKPLNPLEPIGGAGPKFSSDSKSLGTFEKNLSGALSLLCPAQGFPLPSFRYLPWLEVHSGLNNFLSFQNPDPLTVQPNSSGSVSCHTVCLSHRATDIELYESTNYRKVSELSVGLCFTSLLPSVCSSNNWSQLLFQEQSFEKSSD